GPFEPLLRSAAQRRVSRTALRSAPWFETPAFGGLLTMRFVRHSAARAASDRLSSEEMMCSASASASDERSCGLRTSPMRHEGSSGKPSAAERTRMPGRKPDSGNTDTASPDSTAALIALALPLEYSTR